MSSDQEQSVNQLYDDYVRYFEKKLQNKGITSSSELDNEGKMMFGSEWKGIFASDQKLPTEGLYIVNTDRSNQEGTHWMSVNSDLDLLYDSFGRSKSKVLPQWKGKETDHDAEQNDKENNCGQRSLAWLLISKHYPALCHLI